MMVVMIVWRLMMILGKYLVSGSLAYYPNMKFIILHVYGKYAGMRRYSILVNAYIQ